jgi:phosphoribosylamine---glycine ligase
MNILIIGSGGREHALAWKIAQSRHVEKLYALPGSDGIKEFASCVDIHIDDYDKIIKFAKDKYIDLTIIGSEKPLCEGIVNMMEEEGLKVFGPSKKAAQIEGSKSFAKQLMKKYHIPTAAYQEVHTYEEAKQTLLKSSYPIVIKADGLFAGKGVVIASNFHEAFEAASTFLHVNPKVVIEEYLEGIEFSLIAFAHHETLYPFEPAQDYKRAYDDHLGPNTGGMGAYSPVPMISKEVYEDAIAQVMKPILSAMVNENMPFTGFLYGGLMLTQHGVKVIEFNARFGDPEAEVLLPRLDEDMLEVLNDLYLHRQRKISFKPDACVGVVMASKGYPGHFEKGHEIIMPQSNHLFFHMGLSYHHHQWMNSGGRVLISVALGKDLADARQKAYEGVSIIKSDNLFYRKDIASQ